MTNPFLNLNSNNFTWLYGELRGGTPAVLINNSFYFSFFHSSNEPKESGDDVLKTYVMGAYVFCKKPPFKILKISALPIVHNSMYTGFFFLLFTFLHILVCTSTCYYIN